MATYQPPTEILPKFNEFVFNQANEPEYLDQLVVHKAGTETITGNKTITGTFTANNAATSLTASGNNVITSTAGDITITAPDFVSGLKGFINLNAGTQIKLTGFSIFSNMTGYIDLSCDGSISIAGGSNQMITNTTNLISSSQSGGNANTISATAATNGNNAITATGKNVISSSDAGGLGYQNDIIATGASSKNRFQSVDYNFFQSTQNDFQTTGSGLTSVNRFISPLGRNIITSGRTSGTANLIEATGVGINEITSASGSLGANTITATSGTAENRIQATAAGGSNRISTTTGTNTITSTTGRNTLTTAGTNSTANLIDATGAGGGNTIRTTTATGTNTISATGGGSNTITTTTGQNKMENTGLGTNLITTANTAAGSNLMTATGAGGGNTIRTTTGQNLIENTGVGSNVITSVGGTNTIKSTSALTTANLIEAGQTAPDIAGGNTIRTLGTGVNLITGNGGTTIEAKAGTAVYINSNSVLDTAVRLEASVGGITLDATASALTINTTTGVNITSTNTGIKINANPLGSIQYRFYSSQSGNDLMRFANSYTTGTYYNLEKFGSFLTTGTGGFSLPFNVIPYAIQVFCDSGLITGGTSPYYAQFRVCGTATTTNYGEYGTIQGTGSLLNSIAQTYTTAVLTSPAVILAGNAINIAQKMTGAVQPTGITNKHCEVIVFFQQV